MKRKGWLIVASAALACLAIGILWTIRLDVPSPKAWWYGKKTVVRVEVWEPGKDMATFAMTMPKGTLDAMYALGLKAVIETDHDRQVELNRIWKQLQRLPQGQKLRYEEDDATVTIWIEPAKTDANAGG